MDSTHVEKRERCRIVVIHIHLYTYTCGSKINNNDKRTHFLRKIYLSHFIRNGCERVLKSVMRERCVGEMETEQTLTYWPPVTLSLAALLSRSAGLRNQGFWGLGAGSLFSILSPTNWLQLTELPVTPGYIILCRPPASCERRICTQFNPSTVKVLPWYLRPDAPVHWLKAGSNVNMLQRDRQTDRERERQRQRETQFSRHYFLIIVMKIYVYCKRLVDYLF